MHMQELQLQKRAANSVKTTSTKSFVELAVDERQFFKPEWLTTIGNVMVPLIMTDQHHIVGTNFVKALREHHIGSWNSWMVDEFEDLPQCVSWETAHWTKDEEMSLAFLNGFRVIHVSGDNRVALSIRPAEDLAVIAAARSVVEAMTGVSVESSLKAFGDWASTSSIITVDGKRFLERLLLASTATIQW